MTLDFSRAGTTLSEVLISIMVMGIGVVSLATLFPISILRSIQATQLTNATVHRLNAEQLIGQFPRLVHDPDADANLEEHERQVERQRYIVDPVGWNHATLSTMQSEFGNNNGATVDGTGRTVLQRFNGGFTTPTLARQIAYLGDTWQLAAKGTVTSSTSTTGNSIIVPSGTDLTTAQQSLASSALVRVVLYSLTGKQSITRAVTAVNPATNTITWDVNEPLPAFNNLYFNDADNDRVYDSGETGLVSRFRLEIYDQRYSWLFTVRKMISIYPNKIGEGEAEVDVVVYHKRPFSLASEQVFVLQNDANAGDTAITLNLASTNALAPPIKPFLKRGGFVFDATNARWYRIVQIVEHAVNPVITLDRPLESGIKAGLADGPDIMAMAGVVEVYPLGKIPFDTNNRP